MGRKATTRAGGRHGSFARFVGRRVGAGILLVIGITLISFALSHLVPGDDDSITDENWLADVRKHFSGKAVVAKDLMEITLPLPV